MHVARTSTVLAAVVVALSTLACGKVKDPTPKSTTLFDWDRASAKVALPGTSPTPHPLATAKILEGPEKHAYSVTVSDVDGKSFSFDLDLQAAKVTYADDPKDTSRWATTHVTAKVTQNDAFHLTGSCEDGVAMVLGAPGEVMNTVVSCRVVGKRPNSMGTADAIEAAAFLQLEGSGKILSMNDPNVKVTER